LARSRFLDAYVSVEAALCALLRNHEIDPGHRPMGQKMADLRAIKASPKYSKASRAVVHAALDKLEPLNDIRCDIAHSRLQLSSLDGELTACFVNPQHAGQPTTIARHIRHGEFEQLIKDLVAIAKDLSAPPR
jgi:hypothetical protein